MIPARAPDTTPCPPPACEIMLAVADDIADTIEALRVQLRNLEAVEHLLRREAAEAHE